jgi:hypothetical protein
LEVAAGKHNIFLTTLADQIAVEKTLPAFYCHELVEEEDRLRHPSCTSPTWQKTPIPIASDIEVPKEL